MTRYIDVGDVQELVHRLGAAPMMAEMASFIREDFLRWNQFQKSPRTANHSPLGVIELMPTSDARHYAFKYVNGHPRNPSHGLPTVMAFGVLADVATGYPLLLSELTVTTAMRTAATSALAAQVLARPDCRSMALIGNGAQSEFQAMAFMSMLGITELRLFDVDPAATDKLERNLRALAPVGAAREPVQIIRADSVAQAVRGADIVTTVTADKTRATILTPEMIEPGMHINGVGGDCPGKTELDRRILEQAYQGHTRVFAEYLPQTRIEGELQQMDADFPATELWQVLAGQVPGRLSPQEVTLFDSVGFALEDFSALRYLLHVSQAQGVGSELSLVPTLQDPKNLFGVLASRPSALRRAA
ncbi:ornithine cyclodeaminase [Rhodoferax sp.]|uniref:ornithine cyclodeaminase n=1 Tax=Rhodoferax sp. TaxID=50421 RepID=UPI002762B27D|nr:ornithine cyclodeaminase [Rhodoferax sp.]